MPGAWVGLKMTGGLWRNERDARDRQYFLTSYDRWKYLLEGHSENVVGVINAWRYRNDEHFQFAIGQAMADQVGHLYSDGLTPQQGFALYMENAEIPEDITERFNRMSAGQIQNLILQTTQEELDVSRVIQVLKEQNRMYVVDSLLSEAGLLASGDIERFQQDVEALLSSNA